MTEAPPPVASGRAGAPSAELCEAVQVAAVKELRRMGRPEGPIAGGAREGLGVDQMPSDEEVLEAARAL